MKEVPPANILEIGDQESYLSYILSRRGFNYFGNDLRGKLQTYEETLDKAFDVVNLGSYTFYQGDFMQLKSNTQFDIIISLSTIEHAGLGTYGEMIDDLDYDMKMARKIYDWLKPNGVAYITVPYGKTMLVGRIDGFYKEHLSDKWEWRIYNSEHLQKRIIQKFHVDSIEYFFSADYKHPDTGETFKQGQVVSEEVANTIIQLPNLSVGLRMIKRL